MAAKKDDALTREGAGNWRTKDGRFLIRGESGGHWYLIDDRRRDPFGLELVSGPYATVTAAREAIARARADFPEGSGAPELPPPSEAEPADRRLPDVEPSPAASRRGGPAAARRQPGPVDGGRHAPAGAAPAAPVERPARAAAEPRASTPALPRKVAAAEQAPSLAAAESASPKTPAAAEPAPSPAGAESAPPKEPAPAEPREDAWMEALPPTGRRLARTMVEVLEQLGVEAAGDIVRTDLTTDAPEVARAMLLQRVAAIIAEAPDPTAARAIVSDILRLLTVAGRAADIARGFPGWYLVEARTDRPGRPIVLDADDLGAAVDGGPVETSGRRKHPGR
jgi:hypothetical protein